MNELSAHVTLESGLNELVDDGVPVMWSLICSRRLLEVMVGGCSMDGRGWRERLKKKRN